MKIIDNKSQWFITGILFFVFVTLSRGQENKIVSPDSSNDEIHIFHRHLSWEKDIEEIERKTKPTDASHYDIDVDLIPDSTCVWTDMTVYWTNPIEKELYEFYLSVYPHRIYNSTEILIFENLAEFRGINHDKIIPHSATPAIFNLSGIDSMFGSLPYEWVGEDKNYLKVILDTPIKPGERFDISIRFRLDLPELLGRFCQVDNEVFLNCWYPVVAEIDETGWKTELAPLWEKPAGNEFASYDVFAILPPEYKFISTGNIVETSKMENGSQYLHIISNSASYFSIISGKEYEVHEENIDGINLKVYSLENGEKIFSSAKEALEFFKDKYKIVNDDEIEIVEVPYKPYEFFSTGLILINTPSSEIPEVVEKYIDYSVYREMEKYFSSQHPE